MKRLITCPDSAHLEALEFELDEEGRIVRVLRCSRFCPDNHVQCDEMCVRLLNRKHDTLPPPFADDDDRPGDED